MVIMIMNKKSDCMDIKDNKQVDYMYNKQVIYIDNKQGIVQIVNRGLNR